MFTTTSGFFLINPVQIKQIAVLAFPSVTAIYLSLPNNIAAYMKTFADFGNVPAIVPNKILFHFL